jgi:hypothetical protein
MTYRIVFKPKVPRYLKSSFLCSEKIISIALIGVSFGNK